MMFISIAAPQDLQNHQKEERERRKAGDIYKRCDTAIPIKPSEGREREREREREFLPIKMSRFVFLTIAILTTRFVFITTVIINPLQVNIHSNNNNKNNNSNKSRTGQEKRRESRERHLPGHEK